MDNEAAPELDIGLGKICFVVALAREFDAETGPGDERGDADEDDAELASVPESPAFQELRQFLGTLNLDEVVALVALTWLGRDDYDARDLPDVLQDARDHVTSHSAKYLLGVPLLADHLQNALSALDLSCEGMEAERH